MAATAGGTESDSSPSVNACAAQILDLVQRLDTVQREVAAIQNALVRVVGPLSATEAGRMPSQNGESRNEGSVAIPHGEVAEDERPNPCLDPLTWLADRRIKVRRLPEPTALEGAFDELALFLGERLVTVRPFYDAVKRRVAGRSFARTLDLTPHPPQTRSDITTFGRMLHSNGFLSQYHYQKSTRQVVFDPQPDGRVTNFFTGGWLERYVLLTAVRHAELRLPQSLHPLTRTQVTVELPDSQITELDVLIGLPDRVLWLECKTGDWQDHARKFDRVARHLSIPQSHSALVLLDPLSDSQKQSASALSRMTVLNPEELEEFIEQALATRASPPGRSPVSGRAAIVAVGASAAPTPSPTATPVSSVPMQWVAWLNKHGLRPLTADLRRQIIADLIASKAGTLVPLNELAKQLRTLYERAGNPVSMSQISDIAAALRRAGLCVRQSHPTYPDGVFMLRAELEFEEAWNETLGLYLWTLLKHPTLGDHLPEQPEELFSLLDPAVTQPVELMSQLLSLLEQRAQVGQVDGRWVPRGEFYVRLDLPVCSPSEGPSETARDDRPEAGDVAADVATPSAEAS